MRAARLLFSASLLLVAAHAATIKPGTPWFDTSGNRIYAGGAGLWVEDGTYYWVGEGNKVYQDLSETFNMYSSTDLATWTYVGAALTNTSIVAPQPGPYRMERPKVFKCPGTGNYMLWFHCDTAGFAMESVGVAQSASGTVKGPYKMSSPCFQPDGEKSYDMSVYTDATGAYLVRSVKNQFAGISRLNNDCTNTTGIISSGPDVEGQAIFNSDNTYFLWGSHLTGWAPNPALLSKASTPSLNGATWAPLGNPSNDPTTYDSQSAFMLPFTGPSGTQSFIYIGDRWNDNGPGGLQNATYIWLPLQGSATAGWSMPWQAEWSPSSL